MTTIVYLLHAGKFSKGTMVFVNRFEFRHASVTKARVTKYLKLIRGLVNPDGFHSLREFEEQFLSLACATKRHALIDGKVQLVWISVSYFQFSLHHFIYVYLYWCYSLALCFSTLHPCICLLAIIHLDVCATWLYVL
jgi:hypothetical protein